MNNVSNYATLSMSFANQLHAGTTNGGMGGYSIFGCLKYRYMPLSAQA